MAMAVIAGHLLVLGCAGPPSIRGLPVGVALEDLRGGPDLGLGRLQDGALGRSWPGRERLAQVPVVGILGRDHQALPFGERLGERPVAGSQVLDPLAHLGDRLPGSQGELVTLGLGTGLRFGRTKWGEPLPRMPATHFGVGGHG
jgi:hypothetical protein